MIVNKNSIRLFRILADLLLLNISFIAAASLAQSFGLLISRNYMFILLAVLNILWYYTTRITAFYDDFSVRYFSFQVINIIKSVFWQAVTAVLFIFLVKEDLFTRNFILYYSFFLLSFISIRTALFKLLLQYLRNKGLNVRNLVIIGGGELGANFHALIKDNPDFGYNFIGFISSSGDENPANRSIGSIPRLEEIITKHNVEEAVVALNDNNTAVIDEVIRICNKQAVKIHIIPDYFRFLSQKFSLSMIGNYPVISVRTEPLEEAGWRLLKRIFDIIFSLIVIIFVFSWLFPLVAIIIKRDSRGKVFYKQDRVGEKNSRIKVYKFRTLKENRDNAFNPVTDNDPRITKAGSFLRKSNIDELPQFINVLKGEMSVVGPRPHALSFNEKYSEMVEEIKMRNNVKPGISGWAQIHGLRGDAADPVENRIRTIKRIKYDLWYIENWTFWLDIQIILITLWQMFSGRSKGK